MNKISNFLSKISKKTKITILVITLIVLGITVLYQTFAISSNISGGSDNYTVTLNNNSIVTVPANGHKTVYFKIRNNNKGTVKYGVGYKGTNITVKVYSNSESPSTGTITESESKFIKLYIENTSTSNSSVELISILGYENGGNLIVPNGYTLVTKKYEPPVIYNPPINLATHITNLYTNAQKTPIEANYITYELAESVELMNDRFGSMSTGIDAGNIRYYGADPNNYIYFNCSDYKNQNDTTCETWRIIGVFDGKVKIMRGSSIGGYSWDTNAENNDTEINEWSQAKLMKLLNPSNYYTIDGNDDGNGQSLYWNAQSGTCFSGENNATTACDFTSAGLKNDTTRNLIAETTYYTRGHNDNQIFVDEMYDKERVSGTVYSGHSTSWTGKVAIPYPSDYGYAGDLSLCQETLYDYRTCTANNWMKNIITNNEGNAGWLLTPNSDSAVVVWYVYPSGEVYNDNYATYPFEVVPVLSLTSKLNIGSGTGTSSSPYQLSV